MTQLAECLLSTQTPEVDPSQNIRTDMVIHVCNPRTWELEAGGSGVQGHPRYISESGTILDDMRPRCRREKREKRCRGEREGRKQRSEGRLG